MLALHGSQTLGGAQVRQTTPPRVHTRSSGRPNRRRFFFFFSPVFVLRLRPIRANETIVLHRLRPALHHRTRRCLQPQDQSSRRVQGDRFRYLHPELLLRPRSHDVQSARRERGNVLLSRWLMARRSDRERHITAQRRQILNMDSS